MGPGSILHVVTTIEMGGIETLVRDLAALQSAEGYHVSVCCVSGHAGVLEPDFVAKGIGVYCATPYRGKWSLPRSAASMWTILRRVRPQVVHLHIGGSLGLLSALMARLQGARSLVRSLHLCVPNWFERGWRRLWGRLEFAACVRLGVQVVAVGDEVRRTEVERLHIPDAWVHVIDNGIDTDRFKADGRCSLPLMALIGKEVPRTQVFLMLCVARLQPQKNHALLVRAVAELVNRRGPVEPHLLLAGVGELEPDLRRLSQDLGTEHHVHFLGLRRDVPDLLAATDIFVMSSHFEGLPISVIEAMAAAKPVVATNVPGLQKVVVTGQTGWLVGPDDPRQFADGVERFMRDPVLCRTMGLAARARAVSHYSLEACAKAYEALYRQA